MQTDPAWKDNLIFSEYFHGDNGAAIGAFHQTGWTGLIADVILRRHGAARPLTVTTITRKVTGKILDAPPIPLATRPTPNVEAVAAATIPRGAIQPMNARSPFARSLLSVAA